MGQLTVNIGGEPQITLSINEAAVVAQLQAQRAARVFTAIRLPIDLLSA